MDELLRKLPENLARWGNLFEGVFWSLIGLIHLAFLLRPGMRRLKVAGGCAFLAFGASDFVEMQTGAWWRPWWLLAWKALCIAVLVFLLVCYIRRRRLSNKTE